MAINQADILVSLQENSNKLATYTDKKDFFYNFLHAYGLPKSTITLLKKGDARRSVGLDGDVALNRKIYFKAVTDDSDLKLVLNELRHSDVVGANKIRFVLVTNFNEIEAYDLEAKEDLSTSVDLLAKQYAFFLPLAGYEKAIMFSEHPADIRASEKMGRLFDLIKQTNDLSCPQDIHALNVFLTRLLFCFYAEDTGLFGENQFTDAIGSFTQKNGSDIQVFFSTLFAVLNLPEDADDRQKLPTHYTKFPYVNGGLFAHNEVVPNISANARKLLIDCGTLDWSEINPDIFGSMFQAVVDTQKRGNLGQHYTSVPNIMRVIQPLFLDSLNADLTKAIGNITKLQALLVRLTRIRAMDAGTANFLIIAYKELRLFEMRVIDALNDIQPQMYFSGISLDQFFGIEIDDFAAEIAVLSLWIAEHQMSNLFKARFGTAPAPLPLGKAGNITCANSLQVDWRTVMPKVDSRGKPYEVYLLGNPPFLGFGSRSKEQLADMDRVLSTFKKKRKVDYIATFFWLGAQYIQDGGAMAFVSTSSICQGAQTAILWQPIFDLGVNIHFAYQSFPWSNNAKNNAGVHVVIVGLTSHEAKMKTIYREVEGRVQETEVKNISPYLTEGGSLAVIPRGVPLSEVSAMIMGNVSVDGGHLLMSCDEKSWLIAHEPAAEKWIKRYVGAAELIKNNLRYCLWLVGATDADIKAMPLVQARVDKVRAVRLASKKKQTQENANTPALFAENRQPSDCSYTVVPMTTSGRREYLPIGFLDASVIASSAVNMIPNGSIYEFGVLNSMMHNVWLAAVCGRLKSDYNYSSTVVYNTFPWADSTSAQRSEIEILAKEVLYVREDYIGSTLAELYDPDKMPDSLRAAHKALDLAVDALYRNTPFRDNTERLEHLFMRYEKLVTQSV